MEKVKGFFSNELSYIAFITLASIVIGIIMGINISRTMDDAKTENVSQDNDIRRLSVINTSSDQLLVELTGVFSLQHDQSLNQLNVTIRVGENEYLEHTIKLNEWMIYVVEDICDTGVDQYWYEFNLNLVDNEQ